MKLQFSIQHTNTSSGRGLQIKKSKRHTRLSHSYEALQSFRSSGVEANFLEGQGQAPSQATFCELIGGDELGRIWRRADCSYGEDRLRR